MSRAFSMVFTRAATASHCGIVTWRQTCLISGTALGVTLNCRSPIPKSNIV